MVLHDPFDAADYGDPDAARVGECGAVVRTDFPGT